MLGSIGLPELLLILLIGIIIFGAGKLPQLGKGIGEGIRNFRGALKGDDAAKPEGPKANADKPEDPSKGR